MELKARLKNGCEPGSTKHVRLAPEKFPHTQATYHIICRRPQQADKRGISIHTLGIWVEGMRCGYVEPVWDFRHVDSHPQTALDTWKDLLNLRGARWDMPESTRICRKRAMIDPTIEALCLVCSIYLRRAVSIVPLPPRPRSILVCVHTHVYI